MGPYKVTPSGSTTRLQAGNGSSSWQLRAPTGRSCSIATSSVHASWTVPSGQGRIQVGEPAAPHGLVAGPPGDRACYSIGLYCPDVDAVVERAAAAGSTLREAPATFVSVDRFTSIRGPFGVRWSVMTRVEDLSDEESTARVAAWAKDQAASGS